MRIICKHCGRLTPIKSVPYHFVCDCKKVLIWFGEKQGCEIFETGKTYPRNTIKNIRAGNIYKMDTREKVRYYREKYPQKQ